MLITRSNRCNNWSVCGSETFGVARQFGVVDVHSGPGCGHSGNKQLFLLRYRNGAAVLSSTVPSYASKHCILLIYKIER